MIYFNQTKPHPALRNYIRSYWLMETDEAENPLDLLVPDGYPEIFFVLNGSIKMKEFSGEKCWKEQVEVGVIGQVTNRFTFHTAPFSRILFIKLYPWAPNKLFGIPAWHLNNQAVDLNALITASDFYQLSGYLYEKNSLTDLTSILDDFFLKKLPAKTTKNSFLEFVVKKIYSSDGTASVKDMNRHINVSSRYLEKVFKEQIGIAPKQYAQLIRVKKVSMYLLDPRFEGNIREIGNLLEYYDQSHLLKDFRAVMKEAPSVYVQKQIDFSQEDLISYLDQWDYS